MHLFDILFLDDKEKSITQHKLSFGELRSLTQQLKKLN